MGERDAFLSVAKLNLKFVVRRAVGVPRRPSLGDIPRTQAVFVVGSVR